MSARRGYVGRIFVAAILTLLACEPDAPPSVPRLYDEEFDDACAGAPCGWTQVSGPAGAVHSTSTLLPGLRGLALEGDGIVVDGPGSSASTVRFEPVSLTAVVVARCDVGASLAVRVGRVSASASDAAPDVGAELLEAQLRPGPSWPTAGGSSGELRQPLVPIITGTGSMSGFSQRIVSVSIRKDGPGQCEIDSLFVEQPGFGGEDFFTGACI